VVWQGSAGDRRPYADQRQGFYRWRSGGKSGGLKQIRAGALPIESVELSRTVQLWVLNIFLTFRAGVTEWFWRLEEREMRVSEA
jgi:hypothetical protein